MDTWFRRHELSFAYRAKVDRRLRLICRFALYLRSGIEEYAKANTDKYGDSYTTPMTVSEVREVILLLSMLTRKLLENMHGTTNRRESHDLTINDLLDDEEGETLGRLFARCNVYLDGSTSESGAQHSSRGIKFVPLRAF